MAQTRRPMPPSRPGPYHLVWSRDLYQIATGLLAAGDRGAAQRAVHYLFHRQQKPDGGFPQNSTAAGKEYWTGAQLDQYALPIVLAWQLGDYPRSTWKHVRKAADAIHPGRPRHRAGALGEPGRIQPRDHRRRDRRPRLRGRPGRDDHGHRAIAAQLPAGRRPLAAQRQEVDADHERPALRPSPTSCGSPRTASPTWARRTRSATPAPRRSTSVASSIRRSSSWSGSVSLAAATIERSATPSGSSTSTISKRRPRSGRFWHRFSFDGYGETADGGDWVIQGEGTPKTYGRLWPLLTGERGEYAIAARAAGAALPASRWPRPRRRAS